MGLCPFHSEKTPSFSVNDEGGFYHCFGCSAGGNVFKFLMEVERLTFPEAVAKVADRYGIDVPTHEGGGIPASQREVMYAANASAARYFHRFLNEAPDGRRVLDYLGSREVSPDSIELFLLGAAPVSGDGLVRWLKREGVDSGVAVKLGLVGSGSRGYYDRFRGRLMFPIRDGQGRTLGFGGRLVGDDDGPKYLNSPDSDVYHKGRALYGLFESKGALRDSDKVLLVEGYMDVIALHQAGIKYSLATCGTALTVEQARLMRRYTGEVVTLFDGDEAGEKAAARSFPVFMEAGIWASASFIADSEDPDSLLKKGGREALEATVSASVPLADAYLKSLAQTSEEGTVATARVGAELARLLAKVRDPFEYDLLVRKASHWTGLSQEVLRGQARPARAAVQGRPASRGGAAGPEELLVSVILADPTAAGRVAESGVISLVEDATWRELLGAMIESAGRGGDFDRGQLLAEVPEDLRDRIAARLLEDAFSDQPMRERIVSDCIASIEKAARRRHNQSVATQLRRESQTESHRTPAEQLSQWRQRNG